MCDTYTSFQTAPTPNFFPSPPFFSTVPLSAVDVVKAVEQLVFSVEGWSGKKRREEKKEENEKD